MVAIACKNLVFDNIEAIIFDKDGTLEDSQAFWLKLAISRANSIDREIPGIWELLLQAFGIKNNLLEPEGLMAVGSRQENETVAAGCIASKGYGWFEAQKIASQAFIKADKAIAKTEKLSNLFPNSLETIEYLANSKLKLGILSADSTFGVQAFVANNNLEDCIELCMGTDGNLKKPNPKLFLKACRALNVLPHNSLMVGDSVGDIEMAKTAGARATIGFCPGDRSSHLDIADIIISNISEIKILQSLN